MASALPGHFSAMQVGTYFVSQYYHMLQSRPELVHQFYYDGSTMMRVDGDAAEAAAGLQQIHNVIMSLNFTGIEIKTAHSLDSWNRGVLVMISGFVQRRDYANRRKFVQTFFLAPQEKGYFVLNDIFHFLEGEQMHHYTSTLSHSNFQTKLNAPTPATDPVPEYILGGDKQPRGFANEDFADEVHAEELNTDDKFIPEQTYNISEQQQQVAEPEERVEQLHVEEHTAPFSSTVNTVREPPPAPVDEAVGEQPKHTYASILRVPKGQPVPTLSSPSSVNKSVSLTSDWDTSQQVTPEQACPTQSTAEKSIPEAAEEVTHEEEVDSKSVYVGNLPPTISVSDLEHEFMNFGKIRPDGVTVRSRKETGVLYAFIEFEDSTAVQNALKASPVTVNGRQLHVEGRRPNSGISRGRRGRGRGGYLSEGQRGRFGGRSYGRGSGQENDREYHSRPRGNGYAQRGLRQDRGILGNQYSRNGHMLYDSTY